MAIVAAAGARASHAAAPQPAQHLYEAFMSRLEALGLTVARGVFGAHMEVEIVNDGPVTLLVESPARES